MRRRRPPPEPSRRAAPKRRPGREWSGSRRRSTVDCGEATTASATSVDAASRQFLAHALGGQFHRRHRAGTDQAGQQPRAAANDAHAVFERQCSRDDRRGHFAHRMPDDRARSHPVRAHGGRPARPAWRTGSAGPGRCRSRSPGAVIASVTENPDSAAISGSAAATVAANTGSVASRSAPIEAH